MKKNTFKVMFIIRRNQVNRDGKCSITIRITVNGEYERLNSTLSIEPELWDSKAAKAIGRTQKILDFNKRIEEIRYVLQDHYYELQKAHGNVISLDIKKVKLTDFMKALGQEHPVAADGNLRIYNAPYDADSGPTMVINTETNLWRDTKSGAYGGIYDLAYELTGSCNMSELNRYIASEMSALEKSKEKEQKVESPK